MCGITGKFMLDGQAAVSPLLVRAMADAITHRGPDDEGYYINGPLGLGFRRLSIIDLNTGHQPISNEDGSVWIVFNGEIYNYQELRRDLLARGHRFTSKTDTEVIVHLYEEYGPACVEKLRGMFGFAIWNQNDRSLFLARDRVGIKPIYYCLTDDFLVFGSEIKALLADPDVPAEVNEPMIDNFLTYYYVTGEETMLKGVRKLLPGHCMLVKDGKSRIWQYWDLKFQPCLISAKEAELQLIGILEESIALHMIADVPVGVLLSGGVDSTAMLGLATAVSDKPLSSYTLGFDSRGIADERPYARLAASCYGSQHHEMTISAREFADFLPSFAWHMEEPCCEPQAVALYYVSRMAREFVKVVISGEGGDEAFAGYPIYRNLLWLERIKSALGPLNVLVSNSLLALNRKLENHRIGKYAPLLKQPLHSYYFSRTSSPSRFFNHAADKLYAPEFAHHVSKSDSISVVRDLLDRGSCGQNKVNQMLYLDTKTSLPDDLLLKADKMTMANSLELRVPMLDHKFLEFAASLPPSLKVRGFDTKYIAKRALGERVPREILKRKKVGFPVPYESWLRNELKDWVYDVILGETSIGRGYFSRNVVENLMKDNVRMGGFPKEILSLVSLELWHRAFLHPRPAAIPEAAHCRKQL